jgi:SPX domain protein involved in polyphosphate accumulation
LNSFEGTPSSSFDTYAQFLESITETERRFFDCLDLQIDKVEDFYGERYKEALERMAALKAQFHELAEHSMAYHVGPAC